MISMDPTKRDSISIVIPSWNTLELTKNCLASILRHVDDYPAEVIVVDNGSTDGSPDMVAREFPRVTLIRNTRNEYFSKACNQGAAVATNDYLCLLNSDTVVPAGSLHRLMAFLRAHPDYGAAAPRLDNVDGTVQPICRRFPTLMDVLIDQFDLSWWPAARHHRRWVAMSDFDHLSSRDVEQPPGACLVMRRDLYAAIGGFDENLPLFYSDVDLCLSIWRTGKRIRFVADAHVFHVGSASVVRHPLWRAEFMRDQVRYFRKNLGRSAATFAKAIIGLSVCVTALRTLLGRKPREEKSSIVSALFDSAKAVLRA